MIDETRKTRVSIRSPRRSEGRFHRQAEGNPIITMFQSAPPAEARGDRQGDFLIILPVKGFQSAPPAEARGDFTVEHARQMLEHMFQSAPPAEARGDQFPGRVLLLPYLRFQSAPPVSPLASAGGAD